MAQKVSKATKFRWFDRGAAAFAQAFPSALSVLGPAPAPHYVCPECPEADASGTQYRVELFPRSAVETGKLTVEHVPPDSFGGRALLLTCKRCNGEAGTQLEAHARKRENPIDLLAGVTQRPSPVRLTAGSETVVANLKISEGIGELGLPPRKKNANDPRAEQAFGQALREMGEGSTLRITFHRDLYNERRANVTWLRHAYLAMFAIFGYRYIFQAGFGIVRKQIKEPDESHIPLFLAVLPDQSTCSEWRIIRIREPEPLRSWAVQFGKYLVCLPTCGDREFYARLAEEGQIANRAVLAHEVLAWPTEPLFGLGWHPPSLCH